MPCRPRRPELAMRKPNGLSSERGGSQKIRINACAVLKNCHAERRHSDGNAWTKLVHLCGKAIQSTFTSLTSNSYLRRGRGGWATAAEGADVTSRKSKERRMKGTKVLGLAAVGAFLLLAAPAERAQALSLINPGAAATVQDNTQVTTEVAWHHHHHWHHHHWRHRWHHRHWRHRHWHHWHHR